MGDASEYNKRYYETHKEYYKRYYELHKEAYAAAARRWRERHREQYLRSKKMYDIYGKGWKERLPPRGEE